MGKSKDQRSQIAPFVILNPVGRRTSSLLDGTDLDDGPYKELSVNNNLIWPTTTAVTAEESPLVHFVSPVFSFLRHIHLTHGHFEFDPNDRIYLYKPGSWFRKITCLLVHVLVLTRMYGEIRLSIGLMGNRAIVVMYKIMGAAYILFHLSLFYALMVKGQKVCDIFNFTQNMTGLIAKAGCKVPTKKLIKPICKCIVALYSLHAFIYTIDTVIRQHQGHSSSYNNFQLKAFMTESADFGVRGMLAAFSSQNMSNILTYKYSLHNQNEPVLMALGILQLILSLLGACQWLMAFLMLTLWGLLFCKVFYIYFAVMEEDHSSSTRNTLEDIRIFNTITGIINQFNNAFGWTILMAVLTGIAHFSVNIVEIFQSNDDWLSTFMVGITFIMFGLQLLTAAQVNQMATNITELMLTRYQCEPVWRQIHGNCTETLQGMALIFHEIETNKIGFRGFGFFTLTYAFIGSVLSVISTYSVVVLQFK